MLMKPLHSQVDAVVAQVFDRLPVLVGFSVALEPELVLADVETFPWTPYGAELTGEIAVPLLDLMDEEPAARELLRGRTFARSVH
jgi:hypothetical protein